MREPIRKRTVKLQLVSFFTSGVVMNLAVMVTLRFTSLSVALFMLSGPSGLRGTARKSQTIVFSPDRSPYVLVEFVHSECVSRLANRNNVVSAKV